MLPLLRNTSVLAPIAGGPSNRLAPFFDRAFGEDGFPGQTRDVMPLAMWEDEDHVYVEAEVPGMTAQDVDITVHNGLLFLRGERKPMEGRKALYDTRSYGRFERVMTLPAAINADGVEAHLADGILSITLPKSPEAKPRKIALRTE